MSKEIRCEFCEQINNAENIFFENELFIVVGPVSGTLKQHFLVLPRRHVVREEDLSGRESYWRGATIKSLMSLLRENCGAGKLVCGTDFCNTDNAREPGHLHNHVFESVPFEYR